MYGNWLRNSVIWLGLICVTGWMPVAVAGTIAVGTMEKVEDAGEAMHIIMDSSGKSIPGSLLRQSAGVAIFPGVVIGVIKGEFSLGGDYGTGLVMRHNPKTGRWSPPAFYSIMTAPYSLRIGARSTDLVLIIMNDQIMKSLIKGKLTLDGDATAAAGPVARKTQANADVALKYAIYSYSSSRDSLIGLSLEGSKLRSLTGYDKEYYGKDFTPEDILFRGKAKPPRLALALMSNMQRYVK